MTKKIKKILEDLPKTPGIYKMKSKDGEVLYIGKAKELNKRVRHYFQKSIKHNIRTQKLIEKIEDIEVISVDSELEAVILETNLIKQFKPKYNVLMKDDKNYVYIKITKEDFPKIQIVRKIQNDGAKYIGPKPAAHKVKDTFKLLKKIFPFRHCNLGIEFLEQDKNIENPKHKVKITKKTIKYPCLDFYIKRCVAPCIGKVTPQEYQKIIKNIENFLQGKADTILKDLEDQMKEFANQKNFEKAAKMRDKIETVREVLEKQKVANADHFTQDIINYCVTHDQAYFNIFQIRDGKLIGQENFILKAYQAEESNQDIEILSAFIKQYYDLATDIPAEIIIPHKIDNQELHQKIISKRAKHKTRILIPQKGKKQKLLEMSSNNARIFADRNKPKWYQESQLTKEAAEHLQKILKIKKTLKRIECYDISHLSGTNTVGSMIVFENGAPKNDMYRKFKIKTIEEKPDDYKCMEEVLRRRLIKIAKNLQLKDYIIKKIRKKDYEQVKLISEKEKMGLKDKELQSFFIIEKQNKKKGIAGFAKLEEINKTKAQISKIWIEPKERGKKLGHKLIKTLIEKSKSKRVYIFCRKELKDYYLLMGFEEIKKIPKDLEKNFQKHKSKTKNSIALAFDVIKHKPDKSFTKIPDLIIIDGGKGQLSSSKKVIEDLQIKIPYIAIAKRNEEIYIPGKEKPLLLTKNNEALKLIQKARDEAHRFAISYNKQLRNKKWKD